MLLIRPKRPPQYQRGFSFSLSDFLSHLLTYPFIIVAAVATIFLHEFAAAVVVAVPGLIVAYIVAGGDLAVMWELIKEHWKIVVMGALALAYFIKALRASNKTHD